MSDLADRAEWPWMAQHLDRLLGGVRADWGYGTGAEFDQLVGLATNYVEEYLGAQRVDMTDGDTAWHVVVTGCMLLSWVTIRCTTMPASAPVDQRTLDAVRAMLLEAFVPIAVRCQAMAMPEAELDGATAEVVGGLETLLRDVAGRFQAPPGSAA